MKILGKVCLIAIMINGIGASVVSYADSVCNPEQKCTCVDMSQFKGDIPPGWYSRYNRAFKTNVNQIFTVVVMEHSRNIRCRYLSSDDQKFTLSASIPKEQKFKPLQNAWKYDSVDEIWECVPSLESTAVSIAQCPFTFEKIS